MGYILNGKYHKGTPATEVPDTSVENIYNNGRIVRQYERHAHDLIQPHNPDGTPNQDFIDYYEEDAKRYGFIPDDNPDDVEQ